MKFKIYDNVNKITIEPEVIIFNKGGKLNGFINTSVKDYFYSVGNPEGLEGQFEPIFEN